MATHEVIKHCGHVAIIMDTEDAMQLAKLLGKQYGTVNICTGMWEKLNHAGLHSRTHRVAFIACDAEGEERPMTKWTIV